MNFYSQQGEDFFLYCNLINRFRLDGIVVEIGALDGITFSNSKMFEDSLGFKCVLIEPSPISFEKLKVNRPKAHCLNFAAGSSVGVGTFLGAHAVAGLAESLPKIHRDTLEKQGFKEMSVNVVRLDDVFRDIGISYVDLLSIDVEGGEFEVLLGLSANFLSNAVSVVVIELDSLNVKKDRECRLYLETCGFKRFFRLGINDFFVNLKSPRLGSLYSVSIVPEPLAAFARSSRFYSLESHSAVEIIDKSIGFFYSRGT